MNPDLPLDTAMAARFWDIQLEQADREEREWRLEATALVERYRAEPRARTPGRDKRVNILWSNTEILKAALFGRMAKPEVRRRFLDDDPVARMAAQAVERVLEFGADRDDEQAVIEAALEDALLAGRGIVWVSLDNDGCADGPVTIGGADSLGRVDCRLEHVYWEDYRESPAKTPAEVWWKARRHLLTADDLDTMFPDAGPVALDWAAGPGTLGGSKAGSADAFRRAEVWEIWDGSRRQRLWLARGHPQLLGLEQDPYGLDGFFPTPDRPLRFTGSNGSGVPVPEFRLYADQAEELDRLTTRINRLVGALRRRGVYDASVPELKRLAEAGDNEFLPADNYAALAAKGGLAAVFQTEDVSAIHQVLSGLYQQRQSLIQTIYEISGISDILRGAGDPGETATAQRIKGQFGTLRLQRRQDMVQRYVRDLMRLKGEIVAEHFPADLLAAISGLTPDQGVDWPMVTDLLRRDRLRSCRIDIETDSTLLEDAQAERQRRLEFLDMLGGFLERTLPLAQAAPPLAPLLFELLGHTVRGFKSGRRLEEAIDRAARKILEENNSSQPPTDPDRAREVGQ